MGAKRGVKHIAPRIRGYIDSALNMCEKRGKALDQLLFESFQEDVLATIKAINQYIPIEIDMNVNNKTVIEMSDAELYEIALGKAEQIKQDVKH